mmetsp:Transcript_28431/g.87094  ORF Transcript_28431/g.87094 Transcript_28431/m.87094 type:complete len:280 (-) Transcript_28431:330-1169(-)
MTTRRRRVGVKAAARAERGMAKSGAVKRSASTEALAVHVAFLWFWLQVDVPDDDRREELWRAIQARWPGSARLRTSATPAQFDDGWRRRVAELRDARNVAAFLDAVHCCSDEAAPSKTTTWRPLVLPQSVVGAGGRKAGLKRLARIRKFLNAWTAAFFGTTLVAGDATGLGLRARRDFRRGSVVVTGILDAAAPETPISQTEDDVPVLGPGALLNAGCRDHANVRLRFARNGDTAAAVARKPIREGAHILAAYDEPACTCALRNCKKPVAASVDDLDDL